MKMFTRTSRLLATSTASTGWRAGTPFGNDNFLRIGAPLAAAVLVAFAVRERRQHNLEQGRPTNDMPAGAVITPEDTSLRSALKNETSTTVPRNPVKTETPAATAPEDASLRSAWKNETSTIIPQNPAMTEKERLAHVTDDLEAGL